jgi:DNA repair protein RadD
MSAPELRPYQADVIDKFRSAVDAGQRKIMLVAPTGSGKTVIAGAIVGDAVARDQRVLFFSHRREITQQTSAKLYAVGIDHGIIQAGFPLRLHEPVQVASVQTLTARAIRGSAIELPAADLVIVDEAHHAPAETYAKVLAKYSNAIILGLTATPCRRDGRGLGNVFDALIECPQVADLVDLGFLVGTTVYAPADRIDLSGIRTQAGDYVENQLAERMNTTKLVGDVVTHWHRHGERRRTVIFATDVAHSIHLRDEFQKSGVRAEHVDGKTPKEDRDAILGRLSRGEIDIITNCAVLTEGWDCPDVACLVLARPTKSMGLYRQMVGRGLRPAPGKTDCLVLDHAGAVFEHGFVDEPVTWTLDTSRRAKNEKHELRRHTYGSRLSDCPKCGALRVAGEKCRSCGFLPTRSPRAAEFEDGDLGRVDRTGIPRDVRPTAADKTRWHRELTWYANKNGYRPGWAAHKFKEKFGTFPGWGSVTPIPATPEVLSWIRSRQIAYAKAMSKQGGRAA